MKRMRLMAMVIAGATIISALVGCGSSSSNTTTSTTAKTEASAEEKTSGKTEVASGDLFDVAKYKSNKDKSEWTIAVVTNNTDLEASNRIVLTDLDFNFMKQRLFKEPGNYRISDFNVIHSPDSDQETIKDELKILYKLGVLRSENMLDKKIIDNLRKYKTFEVLNVDKREIGIEYPSIGEHMMDSVRRGY